MLGAPAPDAIDDEGLLVAAAGGDGEAFGVFYERHADAILGYFYRRTACPHTAADLAAETFAEALAGLHRFRPAPGMGSRWLFGIAGNLYRKWCRRGRVAARHRHRLSIGDHVLDDADIEHIEQLVDFDPLGAALRDAVQELSPQLRDAVMLRVAEDLPYEDVAARLGCSVGAARVRVSRALSMLSLRVAEL